MRLALIALLALTGVACTHVQPWERSKLAHPSMTNELGGPAEAHMRAVHEGAAGGSGTVESGCGCN